MNYLVFIFVYFYCYEEFSMVIRVSMLRSVHWWTECGRRNKCQNSEQCHPMQAKCNNYGHIFILNLICKIFKFLVAWTLRRRDTGRMSTCFSQMSKYNRSCFRYENKPTEFPWTQCRYSSWVYIYIYTRIYTLWKYASIREIEW